uniref:Uncharacterized protein n=1 Tax=Tanacetum cinerariifolium TaxID=118510 RepID=A0A6L2M914_TANCI|nr:hypothetical protein [Tanacetum cinerariifolium]
MVRNMDSPSKFLMYLPFLQVMINAQVDDLSSHNIKYTSPTLTHKVFANIRRIGKRFSRVETPLFDAMLVPQQVQDDFAEVEEDEDNEVSAAPTPPSPIPTPATTPPPPQQESFLSPPQAQFASPSSPPQQQPTQPADISDSLMTILNKNCQAQAESQEVREEEENQAFRIKEVKEGGIDELDADEDVTRVDVDVKDTDEAEPAEVEEVLEVVTATKLMIEDKAFTRQLEAELNGNIYWNEVIEKVKRKERQDNEVMMYQALKIKTLTEAQAWKNMMIYLMNMDRFKMDFFKEKGENEIEEEGSKRKGKILKQETAKKQRIDEEAEELKRHLQIVANDDDNVYTEAIPLASKNFDREDLEALSKLVKERFESTEPKKFLDDYLLNTLKIMFEKPNVEDNVWRDQKGRYGLAKVKSWKLFESYRVHIITLTTTQMFLLVEKKYPLTHFTLEQMLNNVRLEVKEESEMSLELLRLVRRQLNEGMKMEQYLTFTNHALWKVIVNGDLVSPVTSASAGVEGHIPPKTAEQKLARKNELKAKCTLMLAILDEHLLKFHACKDVKSLWKAIKNSTNETVNTAHSVYAANSKDQASTASYAVDVMFSFFTNQSNAPQLDNEDLKQIDTDDLEEIDLKWQVAMLTMRVKRFINNTGKKLDLNGKETVGFNRTKIECYNYHRRGHFARQCMAPRNQGNRNRDAPRRNAPKDTSTTNALESDIEDENVFKPKEVKKIVKPSLEKIEFVNNRNTTVENENKAEKPRKFSQSPRGTSSGIRALLEALIYRRISFNPRSFSLQIFKEMEHSNNTSAKIPILDIGKFEQWKFRIQQYLQHEHYTLWEVIEFGDSYVVPTNNTATVLASEGTATKKGRTVALTTEDMQKRRNDVKARTTLLLALPDEHQLRFSKYKTAQELWAAILKTFGGNEAIKKTKKNLLKQQYGNFKAKGKETLEQTFNRLQNSSGNEEDITAGVPTASTQVSTTGATIAPASISLDTACAYIASQSNGGRRDNYRQGSKVEEQALKALMAIDRVGWDWSFMANEEENHALVADEEALTEFALMAKTSADSEVCHRLKVDWIEYLTKELENLKNEKEGLESKLAGPPEFADDIINDYTRPSPNVESNPNDLQSSSSSAFENGESTESIISKPEIKFVRPADSPTVVKSNKKETVRKSSVKYAKLYRKPTKRVDHRSSWGKNNNTHKSKTPRTVFHKTGSPPMRTNRPYMNAAQPKRTSFYKPTHSYTKRPFQRTSAVRSQFRGPRVPTGNRKFPTVNRNFPTVNRKFPTGSTKFSTADMGNKGKVVKASACWIWKPSQNLSNKGLNSNSVSVMLKKYTYIDTQGRLKPFDRGYVSFGQGGCKITDKGTVKTEKDYPLRKGLAIVMISYKLQVENYSQMANDLIIKIYNIANSSRQQAAVLTKSGQVPVDVAKQSSHRAAASVSAVRRVNTAATGPNVNDALPTTYSYFKIHSPVRRPFNQKSEDKTKNFNEKVNTARVIIHMIGNKSYLTDYQEINGGFVAFGGNAKGGKITKKGKIRTGKLDFEDVYFVKEHKFNLFSVSQMYDKKNSVLFTDTECIVLSPDFMLLDESQVLLKVSRNNNMYSFDLKNVVPLGGRKPALSFMRPFRCLVTILNTLDHLVFARNQTNGNAGTKANINAGQAGKMTVPSPQYVLIPLLTSDSQGLKSSEDEVADDAGMKDTEVLRKENEVRDPAKEGKHAIGTKWVYRNKKDKRGILVRNKARLVAQGHTQEEGINYDEVFSHVARIEAIRLFLAYASFMGFIVYQMDVKSAFMYGTIEEEVYVCQPPGFEDPQFPDKDKGDIMLVQVYVDDIIFGSTKKYLCTECEGLMHKKFQMSSLGELTFFLGLQVMPRDDGIFISQNKDSISDEFGVKTGSCKVNAARQDLVLMGQNGNAEFHQIVDFLTTSPIHYALTKIHATVDGKTVVILESSVRSDLYFNDEDGITCLSNDEIFIDLTEPFNDVYITPIHTKKVFTNMKRQNKDFSGKITTLFASMLVPQVVEAEGSGQPSEPQPPSLTAPPSHEEQVGDEAVYTGEDDRVVRAATTATSLEAEHESGNINKTQSTATLNESTPQGTSSGSGPRVLVLEHSKTAQDLETEFGKENVSKQGRNLKTRPMFEEGDIDGNKDDIDDMVDEVIENVEEDTVNDGGAVNTATTRVSAASASVTTAGVSISTAEPRTSPITITTVFKDEDLTIAQTLVNMRSEKAKEKGVAFRDVEESARPTKILRTIDPKDKGKGIMQEPKKPPKNPRMAQIQLDEEMAKRMHEEEMAELEKRQSEIATAEEAKKSRMLVEMIAKKKRFFAAQRAAERRSKLPTKAQMRNRMYTYLKNQAGYKHNQLKGRSYDDIQKLFDKAYKQVNSFIPMDSEVVKDSGKKEDSSGKQAGSRKKRACSKFKPKSPKKLKVIKEQESTKDGQEKEELRLYLKIV